MKQFERYTFFRRLKSMLTVDFRRIFTMPLIYLMVGISFAMPILILVMTTLMDGTVSVDPTTGAETVMKGFENVWQAIASPSSQNPAMSMDLVGMCNINLIYFLACVLVCVFVADDFRSGYVKNLFTVRSSKTDYIISKTVVAFVGGAFMIVAFFIGAMIGGAIAGLPFGISVSVGNLICCLLSKVLLISVFIPIYLLMSVIAKQKLWLSILLCLATGMFLFAMIPMITPLDATFLHVILIIAGGCLFSFGLGAISRVILVKKDIL